MNNKKEIWDLHKKGVNNTEIANCLEISKQYVGKVLKSPPKEDYTEIMRIKHDIEKLKEEVNPYSSINRKEFMDSLKEDAIEEVGEHVNWNLDKVINTYIRKALKNLIREQIAELMEERGIIEPRSG